MFFSTYCACWQSLFLASCRFRCFISLSVKTLPDFWNGGLRIISIRNFVNNVITAVMAGHSEIRRELFRVWVWLHSEKSSKNFRTSPLKIGKSLPLKQLENILNPEFFGEVIYRKLLLFYLFLHILRLPEPGPGLDHYWC